LPPFTATAGDYFAQQDLAPSAGAALFAQQDLAPSAGVALFAQQDVAPSFASALLWAAQVPHALAEIAPAINRIGISRNFFIYIFMVRIGYVLVVLRLVEPFDRHYI
jgi:hypothetical protein